MPTRVSIAPMPARPTGPGRVAAATRAATPPAVSSAPMMPRVLDAAPCSIAWSRNAATGATREDRTDGATPATSVATTPAPIASTMLDALNTRPPAGSAKPKPSNTPLSPAAMPIPAPQPAAAPTRPTPSASSMPEPITCRRVAPSARSSADVRLRWAAMIENVL